MAKIDSYLRGRHAYRVTEITHQGQKQIQGLVSANDGSVLHFSYYTGSHLHDSSKNIFAELVRKRQNLPKKYFPQVVDSGFHQDNFFLIELIPKGSTLNTKSHTTKWDEISVITLGIGILDGLEVLHSRNACHGQLCARKIFIPDADLTKPLLLDTGNHTILTDEGPDVLSDLYYAAPERFGLVTSTSQSAGDFYSLGLILYELLTGSLPFRGSNLAEVARDVFTTYLPHIAEIKSVSAPLALVIERLIRKSPTDRYQTTRGLKADLKLVKNMLLGQVPTRTFALGRYDTKRELNYKIPIVGRSIELKSLTNGLLRAKESKAVFQLISAVSGMGKTRIAQEIIAKSEALNFETYVEKFQQYESNVPLSVFRRIFQKHAEYLRKCRPNELKTWQETILTELGASGQLLVERIDSHRDLFPDFPPKPDLSREEGERIFFEAMGVFLSHFAIQKQKAALIFIDDLQWCDSTSLRLLTQIAQLADAGKLLNVAFLAAYRSEELGPEHPFAKEVLPLISPSHFLHLGPFSKSDSGQLVELLLDENGPEVEKIKDFCWIFSQGIPFHIYQILESALVQGLYTPNLQGEWKYRYHEGFLKGDPDGLANLVHKRLQALSPSALLIIRVASVSGMKVDLADLKELAHLFIERETSRILQPFSLEEFFHTAIDELERAHFISKHRNHLSFSHDRIQKSSWELLSFQEQVNIHHDYAVILGRKSSRQKFEVSAGELFELAYHLIRGDPSRCAELAIEALTRAGSAAMTLFAYRKARDYLAVATSLISLPSPAPGVAKKELNSISIQAFELYGDALSLAEDIEMAITTYHTILPWVQDRCTRAEIHGKLSINYQYLFRFSEAIEEGLKGIKELNKTYISSEWYGLIVAFFILPKMCLKLSWMLITGKKPNRTVRGREDKAYHRLMHHLTVPTYFLKPICAIANFLPFTPTREYKECDESAALEAQLTIGFASIGWDRVARYYLNKTWNYFHRHPNPTEEIYLLTNQAYLLEFPLANLELASQLLDKSLAQSIRVGESFWRLIAYIATIHVETFGKGYSRSSEALEEMILLQKKMNFDPGVISVGFQLLLEQGRTEELENWRRKTEQSLERFHRAAEKPSVVIYAKLALAEILMVEERYDEALPLMQEAFRIYLFHGHRMAKTNYAPLLLAEINIRTSRPWAAVFPMAVAWINKLFLGIKIFSPQTWFLSGELFQAMGLRKSGLALMQKGLNLALQNGWHLVSAKLKLKLGLCMIADDPERASGILNSAREYFESHNLKSSLAITLNAISRAEATFDRMYPDGRWQKNFVSSGTGFTQKNMRKKIEMHALIEMFLRLSASMDFKRLIEAAMDTLMSCTGADHAVVFLKTGHQWQRTEAKVLGQISEAEKSSLLENIDMTFLNAVAENPNGPKIRPKRGVGLGAGDVLVVPFEYETKCSGLVYLSHREIRDLFNSEHTDVIQSVATQIAISLYNFTLLNEVHTLNSSLAKHLSNVEAEVAQRTRDIKSIFQAIELGIVAILPGLSVHHEYSAHLETIFEGKAIAGQDIIDLLFDGTTGLEETKSITRHSLNFILDEDAISFDLNSENLPNEIICTKSDGHKQILELQWSPETDDENRTIKVLLVLRDVSKLRELETEAFQRRRELTIIEELLRNEASINDRFLKVSAAQVASMLSLAQTGENLLPPSTFDQILAMAHTLKGTSRMHRLSLLSSQVHGAEEHIIDLRDQHGTQAQGKLCDILSHLMSTIQQYEKTLKFTLKHDHAVSLASTSNSGLLSSVMRGLKSIDESRLTSDDKETLELVLHSVRQALKVPASAAVQRWFIGLDSMAQELAMPSPLLNIDVGNILLPESLVEDLTGIMIHLIRNALDHGIEPSDQRIRLGKNPKGLISIEIKEEPEKLKIRFSDDGQGLDLEKIQTLAIKKNLSEDAQPLPAEKLAEMIFHQGFSTKDKVTMISGRGIGMNAVRSAISALGGQIHIELAQPEQTLSPFSIVIELPWISDSSQDGSTRISLYSA